MNPVAEVISRLSIPSSKQGVVMSINNTGIKIAIGGVVEKWPFQEGLLTGDTVLIHNGRLIKSAGIREGEVFEV
jgi:hypothetical protein